MYTDDLLGANKLYYSKQTVMPKSDEHLIIRLYSDKRPRNKVLVHLPIDSTVIKLKDNYAKIKYKSI